MLAYIVRRLLGMIPTLVVVSILTFVIIHLAPGDFLTTLATQAASSGGSIDQAAMDSLRQQYGLDKPVYVQYLTWVAGFPRGDFGYSFEWKKPVGDVALTTLGFIGLSIPDFMLGLVYLFVGVFVFNAQTGGLVSPDLENAPWSPTKVLDFVNHLIWPTIILGAAGTAQLIRIMRGNLLEILGQQFITTARAKGLPERTVINKYAVRVAINPLISVMGMQLPHLISGATILGIVLSLPTTGPLFLNALLNHDIYLAGTFLLMLAVLLMLGNLLADLLLAWVDPRIR